MNSTSFLLDALPHDSFEGFDTGESWNGWAVPLFNFAQAQTIAAAIVCAGWHAEYSTVQDAFVFSVNQDIETGQSDESESFTAIEHDGQKYYPVGSGSWIWEASEITI